MKSFARSRARSTTDQLPCHQSFEHLCCSAYKLWRHKHSSRSERSAFQLQHLTRVPLMRNEFERFKLLRNSSHSFALVGGSD
ncbi:hypothetical protein TYRP_001223 [Tyrophagus putrescentiae]|nr:hypothetical protein TYRP_001223 [Tyrophagus putrescentiae]